MNRINNTLLFSALLLIPGSQAHADSWFGQFLNSVLAYSPSSPMSTQPAPAFTEYEMRNYVNQQIASLEFALRSRMHSSDLENLKKAILYTIQQAQYAYQSGAGYMASNKVYKKDIVDQFMASAVLDYIEKTSFNYANSRMNNRDGAKRIAESMRNNALAIIAQNSVIDYERLAQFLGYALERAINNKMADWYNQQYAPAYTPAKPSAPAKPNYTPAKPSAPVKPTYQAPVAMPKPSAPPLDNSNNGKLYTSTECVVCLEEFGGTVKRLYLKPCGHDMCKQCAFDWFFGSNQKRTCPQCRANVNLDALQNDIV